MADFNSSIIIPNLTVHLQRGGGPSLIFIETLRDFTDEAVDAEWDALTLFQQTDFSVAPGPGASTQDLNITFVDGTKYSTQDISVDESPDVVERTFQVALTDLAVLNLPRRTKGKKFFFAYPVKFIGTTKIVEFGYGEFKREFTFSQSYGSYLIYNVGIRYQPTQLATTPTFPTLPANTDALFTTDAENMQYLGWLLAAADATKGGFGAAVAMPTFTDLPGDAPYCLKSFSV